MHIFTTTKFHFRAKDNKGHKTDISIQFSKYILSAFSTKDARDSKVVKI